MPRLVAIGDSVLDSGRYSGGAGTSAPELLARSLGAELQHLARDGHTAKAVLDFQIPKLPPPAPETVLIASVGGNDLLSSIASRVDETRDFAKRLDEVLSRAQKALRPDATLIANVYDPSRHDPSFAKWITEIDRALAVHARFNEVIAEAARTHGATLVDLCSAFRAEEEHSAPWIVSRIEPSAEGAKQIARLFREALIPW